MKLNYCTLFDSAFLPYGLTMYRSLLSHCRDFNLYIFPFDSLCEERLTRLNLENVTIVSLKDFENASLLNVKNTRSKKEYYWTCASSTILYCIEKFQLDHCTYIDADLFFFNDPAPLYDEFNAGSVFLTEHRYTERFDVSSLSGKYCVQYASFKNDADGLTALRWWVNSCIEWCYDRHEEGKFGDQKYLDDWLTRFKNIIVTKNPGAGVAPWNVQQYNFTRNGKLIQGQVIKTHEKFNLVFYHFHEFRQLNQKELFLGGYPLRKRIIDLIYRPYILTFSESLEMIKTADPGFLPVYGSLLKPNWKRAHMKLYRRLITGNYNIVPLDTYLKKN
jgi:hypothetical protein